MHAHRWSRFFTQRRPLRLSRSEHPTGSNTKLCTSGDLANREAPNAHLCCSGKHFNYEASGTDCCEGDTPSTSNCCRFFINRGACKQFSCCFYHSCDSLCTFDNDDTFEVRCGPTDIGAVCHALSEASIAFDSADRPMVPSTIITVTDEADARKILKLIDALEELDDVEEVFFNFDIPEELVAALSA